jgi:hypothetical protein
MATGYVLSEMDVRLLRELVAQQRRGVRNTTGRPRVEVETDPVAPEVYVARTPGDGIPQLAEVSLGTGTGTGTTVGEDIEVVLGSAVCDVYRLDVSPGGGDATLTPVTGLTRRVFNLFGEGIAGGRWLPVAREKYGAWLAMTLVTAADDEYGTGTGTGGEGDEEDPGFAVTVQEGGVTAGRRETINFVAGAGVTIVAEDSEGDDRVNLTFSLDEGDTGTSPDTDEIDVYHNAVLVARRPAVNVKDSASVRFSVTDDGDNEWVDIEAEVDLVGTGTGGEPPTPTVTVISVTNITDFTEYVSNTWYFNEYDQTVYVNVTNVWYQFCPCNEYGTGTGTGTVTVTDDELVKVSGDDTTPGYLAAKLVAGPNVTLTEQNGGANETLEAAALSRYGADSLGATEDDYDPGDYDVVKLDPDNAGSDVTGMASEGAGVWRVLTVDADDTNIVRMPEADAGSAANNQWVEVCGSTVYLSPGGAVLCVDTGAGWHPIRLHTGEILWDYGAGPSHGAAEDDMDLGGRTVAYFTPAGDTTFTGFANGAKGRGHLIVNANAVGSSAVLTLADLDAGSAADNQIRVSGGEDMRLASQEAALILHDGSKWHCWKLFGGTSGMLDALDAAPADGDILVRVGGVWTLLPVGTDGDVLTLVSGVPAWVAP